MLQTDASIGWQDYLAVVFRRRWFFLIPCLGIAVVGLISGLFMPKIFRAETVLLVEDQQVMNPLIRGLAISTAIGEQMRTLREEMLSWTSLSRLVHELGLDKQARNPVAFEGLIKRLQRDVSVRVRGQDLISISYEDQDPKLAQQLVNTLTTIYMNRSVESQSAEAETAIKFIESEMAVYKKKLEDAERALRDFQELYVMQMPVASQLNDQIVELEVALARMLVENTEEHPVVVQTTQHIQELKRKRNDEIKRVVITALVKGADPGIYEGLARAIEEPASAHPDDPKVAAARNAYQAWVARLDSPVTPPAPNAAAPVPVQIVTTTQEGAEGLSSALEVLNSSSVSLSLAPREQQELTRLTRDYDVYRQNYQNLQQRLERAKITQRLGDSDEGTRFKILEPARLPLKPVRPNYGKIFFFSLLLGIFVGAGLAFVVEYLDQSFQTAEDMQTALELPVLGSISTIVTEGDLVARNRQRKGWVSFKRNLERLKTYVLQPVWAGLDRVLVRLGL